ncbi:MAG TPA: hypothetical protein VN878_03860 [Usitatibacter sp.]|nr:hypothetical protein [Usitatibacter sp.]
MPRSVHNGRYRIDNAASGAHAKPAFKRDRVRGRTRGVPVNPLGIRAQGEGGTIDALSTALNLEMTVKDGRVVQPAPCEAIFNACAKRIRDLPIRDALR